MSSFWGNELWTYREKCFSKWNFNTWRFKFRLKKMSNFLRISSTHKIDCQMSPIIIIIGWIPLRYRESFCYGPSEADHTKKYQTAVFNPLHWDTTSTSVPLIWESSPPDPRYPWYPSLRLMFNRKTISSSKNYTLPCKINFSSSHSNCKIPRPSPPSSPLPASLRFYLRFSLE